MASSGFIPMIELLLGKHRTKSGDDEGSGGLSGFVEKLPLIGGGGMGNLPGLGGSMPNIGMNELTRPHEIFGLPSFDKTIGLK